LDLLDVSGRFHLQYCGYLVEVGFYSPLSNQIPEEFAGSYSESALLWVEPHIVFLEESENFL